MNIVPKNKFIDSTRELINANIEEKEVMIVGLKIVTNPEVFDPSTFFSSQWFAQEISRLTKNDKVLIEVGCGTGIVSIKCAVENPGLMVHATDIIEQAAEQTRRNANLNDVGDRIHTYHGDVLDGVPMTVHADSIFWAMPFGFLEPGDQLVGRDTQVFDPGYRAIRKFFASAKDYLNVEGRLLVGFSIDIGHLELLQEIAHENNFSLDCVAQTKGIEKEAVSMEIYEARSIH